MPLLYVFEQRLSPAQNEGLTISWSSSIKPRIIRLDTSVAPPTTYMSLPGCCFSFPISSTSRTIRVGFHATLSSVLERTIWGVLSAQRA